MSRIGQSNLDWDDASNEHSTFKPSRRRESETVRAWIIRVRNFRMFYLHEQIVYFVYKFIILKLAGVDLIPVYVFLFLWNKKFLCLDKRSKGENNYILKVWFIFKENV